MQKRRNFSIVWIDILCENQWLSFYIDWLLYCMTFHVFVCTCLFMIFFHSCIFLHLKSSGRYNDGINIYSQQQKQKKTTNFSISCPFHCCLAKEERKKNQSPRPNIASPTTTQYNFNVPCICIQWKKTCNDMANCLIYIERKYLLSSIQRIDNKLHIYTS